MRYSAFVLFALLALTIGRRLGATRARHARQQQAGDSRPGRPRRVGNEMGRHSRYSHAAQRPRHGARTHAKGRGNRSRDEEGSCGPTTRRKATATKASGSRSTRFQPLENGNVMIAESGAGRIIEIKSQGRVAAGNQTQDQQAPPAPRDTRLARKLSNRKLSRVP